MREKAKLKVSASGEALTITGATVVLMRNPTGWDAHVMGVEDEALVELQKNLKDVDLREYPMDYKRKGDVLFRTLQVKTDGVIFYS